MSNIDFMQELDDDIIDEVVENETEYGDESVYSDSDRMIQVVSRIEQAKLYELLLKHDFFAPGSARPEIQSAVTNEIRDFIFKRLEELVGIRAKAEPTTTVKAELPFDDEQISALKAIAERLINKNKDVNQVSVPQVNQFESEKGTAPAVQTVKVPEDKPLPRTTKKTGQTTKKKKRGRPKKYKPQAVHPSVKPKKMPSQSEMDQMNAKQANNTSTAMSAGSQILDLAVKHAQHANRDVQEDEN